MFLKEAEGIFRLRVPFENIETGVFLLKTPCGPVLYDCATTAEDTENVILPALAQMHIPPEHLHALVLSHAHADHCGGAEALLQHAPQLRVFALSQPPFAAEAYAPLDGEMLFNCIRALHLPGHTADCLGLYDTLTGTLLTADALQLRGIGRYGCSVTLPDDYIHSVEKIRCLSPRRILLSHDYVPYGEKAEGAQEIARCLDACLNTQQEISQFVAARADWVPAAIAEAFSAQYPDWPLLPKTSVKSLLNRRDFS